MLTKDTLTPVLADTRYLVKTAFAAQTVATGNTITASDAWTHSGAVSFTAAGTAVSVTNNATVGGTLGVTGLTTLTGGFASVAASTVNGGLAVALSAWRTNAGTAFSTRATDGTSVKFSVSDLGVVVLGDSVASNSTLTVNAAANTGINVPLSGSTNGTGAAWLGPFVALRSTNGFVEITSDQDGGTHRGFAYFGQNNLNYAGIGWDGTNSYASFVSTGGTYQWNTGNGTRALLASVGSGGTVAVTLTSLVAGGANTGFTFNASNAPNTLGAYQSNGADRFTLPGGPPASVAGNGTAAVNGTLVGSAGGASSGVTGQTGGTGSSWTRTAGAGGAVAGAGGIGGAGGDNNDTAGNGGNGATTGGRGGNHNITAGNAGTGGNANGGSITLANGTATGTGTPGSLVVTGGNFTVSSTGRVVTLFPSTANNASIQITGTGGSSTTVMLASNGAAFLRGSSTNGFFEITSDFGAANQTGKIAFGSSSTLNCGFGWNTVLANMIITSKNDRISFINDSDGLEAWRLTTNTGASITSLTQTSLVAAGANTAFTFNGTNGPSTTAVFQSSSSTVVTISSAGAITVGASGPVISKAATSAALSIRNATATLADLNLNVLGAAPGSFADGDCWVTDIAGTRKWNVRIAGVSYSATLA